MSRALGGPPSWWELLFAALTLLTVLYYSKDPLL